MGTTAHVIVTDGPSGLADRAVARLEELEARWSRFRPDSEISRLNERPGVPVLVSPDTYELIERALDGWRLTAGRFDPTLLRELRAAGYDRSFELAAVEQCSGGAPSHGWPRHRPAPVDPLGRRADPARPHRRHGVAGSGVEIDPGGIGKGLAADLVVELMLAEGARGALVNVGGDLRVEGVAPEGDGWVVAIADPNDAERVVGTIALDAGAVASTWRTKRAWTAPDGTPRHHLIDPATGLPAASGLAGVTVITGRAWQAEVLAKAAFLAGPVDGAALLAAHDAAGLLVADDGQSTNRATGPGSPLDRHARERRAAMGASALRAPPTKKWCKRRWAGFHGRAESRVGDFASRYVRRIGQTRTRSSMPLSLRCRKRPNDTPGSSPTSSRIAAVARTSPPRATSVTRAAVFTTFPTTSWSRPYMHLAVMHADAQA